MRQTEFCENPPTELYDRKPEAEEAEEPQPEEPQPEAEDPYTWDMRTRDSPKQKDLA